MKKSIVIYDSKFRFLISLKILGDIKHQKLFFYSTLKNSYNFLMGLKIEFYEFSHEKFRILWINSLWLRRPFKTWSWEDDEEEEEDKEYKKRFFKIAKNFCGYEAPKVIFLFKFKKIKRRPYGFKKSILMNLGMRNSLVIYDQKIWVLKFRWKFWGKLSTKSYFFIIIQKIHITSLWV